MPLSDATVSVTREICSDPVEAKDATWTCGEITSGAPQFVNTFESPRLQAHTDLLTKCQTTAKNKHTLGPASDGVAYTAANEADCKVEKCVCNPIMCESADKTPLATGPQIFLPTTLSDEESTVVQAETGCQVINSTTIAKNRRAATKDAVVSQLQVGEYSKDVGG